MFNTIDDHDIYSFNVYQANTPYKNKQPSKDNINPNFFKTGVNFTGKIEITDEVKQVVQLTLRNLLQLKNYYMKRIRNIRQKI